MDQIAPPAVVPPEGVPSRSRSRRRSVWRLLRWLIKRNGREIPPMRALAPYPPPPGAVAPGTAAVTFIGHSSFLIRLPGLTLLTDPIWSDRCSPVRWAGPRRFSPPGLALDALPPIDLVLVSHNHYDHMDLPTLRWLARNRSPAFITLRGNAVSLAGAGITNAIELDWWQRTRLGAAAIVATPARHFSGRGLRDRNKALWGGFMVMLGGRRVFFAGDSGDGPHWREIRERLGTPDLAILPIGAYLPRDIMSPVHINPEEAVAAHRTLQAEHSIGSHFGTFRLTAEPVDEPPAELARARTAAGLAPDAFVTLGIGETAVVGL